MGPFLYKLIIIHYGATRALAGVGVGMIVGISSTCGVLIGKYLICRVITSSVCIQRRRNVGKEGALPSTPFLHLHSAVSGCIVIVRAHLCPDQLLKLTNPGLNFISMC